MKKRIESFLIQLVRYEFAWWWLKPFSTIGIILYNARESLVNKTKTEQENNHTFLSSHEVRNGPFREMKYPKIASVGSAIYPKLLGSYEQEIQPHIEKLIYENYSEIIDVGCAEGYYAVGFALRSKNSKIFAYDIDEEARELCVEMARLNDVSDRVQVGSKFTPETLSEFPFTGKGLILCDCEGFEKTLFTVKNLDVLKRCDLLIETHDFIDINISTSLKKLFHKSHEIESIMSVDDIQKALKYSYKEIEGMSLEQKRAILAEGRPSIMEWLICRVK